MTSENRNQNERRGSRNDQTDERGKEGIWEGDYQRSSDGSWEKRGFNQNAGDPREASRDRERTGQQQMQQRR
ncbi:MAG: hypothetical protein EPN86_05755 [Nanoarchaeota archaeon]|nr:MAG: hypothetical protein EPN86_05755 [Nanoarchaeota archaeon]